MENETIKALEQIRNSYKESTVEIVEGFTVKTSDILRRIELYYNSEYESGKKNQLGQDKPFYNIVKFRVNVAKTATDLDTKDIQIISDKPEFSQTVWIYQKEIHKWMKESNFAYFLNQLGFYKAKYGCAFVKRVQTDDELILEVCNPHTLSFDPKSFSKYTPIFECHYLSPAELYEKKDVWDNVEEAIKYGVKKGGNYNGETYTKGDIKVYEVVGCIDGEIVDKEGYPLMHIIYACDTKGRGVILFEEELEMSNFKIAYWDKINGRTLGVGIVEDGFEAQKWTNDTIQRQKAMLDTASKIIFKTTDETLGNNVLTELENGDVIKIGDGKEFNQVNSIPSQMPAFTEFLSQWDTQLERATSTFNAITGENMPSNTPYRSVAILNNAATSMYEYKIEETGIFLQEVFEDWVFPYIEKKLNKAHILSEDFTADELAQIDSAYAIKEANEVAKKALLEDRVFTQEEYQAIYDAALQEISMSKTRRFLDIPKDFYKNIEAKATLVITNENQNKAVMLESLSKVLQDVAQNPAILQNPLTAKIFNRIIDMSNIGINPAEFAQQQAQPQPQELQPVA